MHSSHFEMIFTEVMPFREELKMVTSHILDVTQYYLGF